MTTRDALLAAVLAAPDDDVPRLVFADFLEENGDPDRAAFIRLEVEAERHPLGSMERAEFERVAAQLYVRHADRWNAELPAWANWNESRVLYRRGFPTELQTTARRLWRDGRSLFAVAPIEVLHIRHSASPEAPLVDVGDRPVVTAVDQPGLSAIHTLRVGPDEPSTQVVAWTLDQSLARLRRLLLAGNRLFDVLPGLIFHLSESVFARTLTTLDLSDNQITDAGAAYLYAAPWVDRLSELDLSGNPIWDPGRMLLRQRFGDRVKL